VSERVGIAAGYAGLYIDLRRDEASTAASPADLAIRVTRARVYAIVVR